MSTLTSDNATIVDNMASWQTLYIGMSYLKTQLDCILFTDIYSNLR